MLWIIMIRVSISRGMIRVRITMGVEEGIMEGEVGMITEGGMMGVVGFRGGSGGLWQRETGTFA